MQKLHNLLNCPTSMNENDVNASLWPLNGSAVSEGRGGTFGRLH